MSWFRPLMALLCFWLLQPNATRAETIEFEAESETLKLDGNVLAEDSAGTILFEARDLRHFVITPSKMIHRADRGQRVEPFTKKELTTALKEEFGSGFRISAKGHYLLIYSCPVDYAEQSRALFERAYNVFCNYFRRAGFKLEEPKHPMIAIICGSREEYVRLVEKEIGPFAASTAGIYSPRSNRMYMFNAFGGEVGEALRAAPKTAVLANTSTQLVEQNVSTVIHEAIHQIAFNTGFHNRNVASPLWLVEGMAMFFESPDLDARGGWRGVGEINRPRALHLDTFFNQRPANSLKSLVLFDETLREPRSADKAYSEAWGFTYFLAKAKTDEYMKYIKKVNERPMLTEYTPEERLADFRSAFGVSPEELDEEFQRYYRRGIARDLSR